MRRMPEVWENQKSAERLMSLVTVLSTLTVKVLPPSFLVKDSVALEEKWFVKLRETWTAR